MSYQITSSEYLGSARLSIKLGDWRRLAAELGDELPECTFLNEVEIPEGADEEVLPIKDFWWYGEGSGRSEGLFLVKVAPHLIGSADVLLVWKGGDSQSGWRIADGKVTDCEVVIALVPE